MRFKKIRNMAILLVIVTFLVYTAKNSGSGGLGSLTSFATKEIKEGINGAVDAIADKKAVYEEPSSRPIVLFCPRDSCGLNMEYMINSSKKVHCAFFDLDLENVEAALIRKNALVVVDADNFNKGWPSLNFRNDTRTAFMHNKFCIFDDSVVWTGSFNPTHNCDERNNNNAVIIGSKALAENYEAEFQELWGREFGKGERVEKPSVMLDGIPMRNYFCPEDFCANNVMEALSMANRSIYFMTFSFTHDKIGDLLVRKNAEGLDIKGVFERTQESRYSEMQKLNQSGIKVKLDSNPGMMHHKVFIIDSRIVVTGSFNPSINGDTKNDENIIIIDDEKIAQAYKAEYDLLSQN